MQRTLLLVDDDTNLLQALEGIFQEEGYQVFTASSGAEGLELLAKIPVQVIISDQRMPNMTGTEFFFQVKKLYPKTVRIVLSGYADFDAVKDAINEDSIYKFLTKPCKNDLLLELVKEAFQVYENHTKNKYELKKEAEAEIKRLQKEFLDNMSHEIRTPLNGLVGFSEVLYNGVVDPNSPEHKECLKDILDSSHLLSRLISNILDLAQAESGKMEFNPVPVNLYKLLSEVKETLSEDIIRKGMTIDIKVDSTLTGIVTDPEKLKQVLRCYLTNAIKFSQKNGKIEVSVLPENKNEFRVEVKDYGIGIREEDIHKLFRPFQQLDMSAAKKYPGTGIELALTKKIVEQQRGRVGVNSVLGKGSTFFAILPIKGVTE